MQAEMFASFIIEYNIPIANTILGNDRNKFTSK